MGLGRKIIGGAMVGGVAIFAGTGAFEDKTVRNDNGDIVEAGGLGAFVLQVGDCFQEPDDADEVASVEGVPCGQPHDAQVYGTFDLTAPSFPEPDPMDAFVAEGCLARWAGAIGTDYENDLELELSAVYPTAESWAQDDREVACLVVSLDGSKLVGSKLNR